MRDDGSIGNASDNLEAASEAPSNHSGSSIDLEENDQNDNLSDMVSANVSGLNIFQKFIQILAKKTV